MAAKASTPLMAAAMMAALLLAPLKARAIEVKKSLYSSNGSAGAAASQPNPLNEAQKQALQDAVANDSDHTLGEESEKKASGQNYVDLDHARFSYMPAAGSVTAKLAAPECKGKKGGALICSPTGTQKTLVFKYKLAGNKLSQSEPPKWEGPAAQAAKIK